MYDMKYDDIVNDVIIWCIMYDRYDRYDIIIIIYIVSFLCILFYRFKALEDEFQLYMSSNYMSHWVMISLTVCQSLLDNKSIISFLPPFITHIISQYHHHHHHHKHHWIIHISIEVHENLTRLKWDYSLWSTKLQIEIVRSTWT